VTACFGLAGLVTVLAAINVGTCRFGILTVVRQLSLEPEDIPAAAPALAVVLMTASQALFNHLGIRLTSRLVDFSGYLILVVAFVLTGTMLVFGGVSGFDLGRLVTFTNYSGAAGKNTWPETADLVWLFANPAAQQAAARFSGNSAVRFEYTVISNIYAGGLPPAEAAGVIVDKVGDILAHKAAGNRLEALTGR
jgi:hypothetical protein